MNLPPALLYHKIDQEWEVGVTFIPPRRFAYQMELLKSNAWETILPGEPVEANSKQFVLSFDDGYESVFRNALPVCERLGYKGVLFIPSAMIGRWNDWDNQLLGRRFRHLDRMQLQQLVKAGWMIGSHGISHCDMTALTSKQCHQEMVDSRQVVEEITGKTADWIAFPYGRYNRQTVECAISAGYTGAVTPVLRQSAKLPGFTLLRADPVYLWDRSGLIPRRLNRVGVAYNAGRLFRRITNLCTTGTLGWNRVVRRGKISTRP